MKVLLVNAATLHVKHKPALPLGLLSIAKYLTDAGHQATIYDRTVENKDLTKRLESFKPDIVGISALTNKQFRDAAAVSTELKKRGIPVVWGGATASAIPDIILKSGVVDYVVVGEGEITFKELIDALESTLPIEDIAGLAYRKNGEVCVNKDREYADLSQMPILDFSYVNPELYFTEYIGCSKMLYLYTSKGCPFSCSFCYNHCFHKHTWRVRPIEYFLQEAEYLITHHGMDGVMFSDDFFTSGLKYTEEICGKIEDSGLNFFWGCTIRADTCTKEEIALMHRAGCRWVFFGIETGSPERQKKIGKNLDLQKTKDIAEYCQEVGVFVSSNFIIGYPDETEEELKASVEYMKSLNCNGKFASFLGVLPGSILYHQMIEQGYFKKPDTFLHWENFQWVDVLGTNYSKVPDKELKVVWAWFSWQNLFVKSVDKHSGKKNRMVLRRAVSQTFDILKHINFHAIRLLLIEVRELSQIVVYATMFPAIKKKYGLNTVKKH